MTDVANSSNDRATIIVAGGDKTLVEAVAATLRYEGFLVVDAATGEDLLATGVGFDPDLIILEWTLPDIAGPEAVRRLRARGFESSVLYLTEDGSIDVGAALEAGDDYLARPFSLAEMIDQVQMILQRPAGLGSGEPLRFADLVLDEERHEVFRDDQRIDLTPTEFNLLRFFLLHPRRVLSKRQILQHVWRYDLPTGTSVVETYVSYLRRKLDRFGPPLIKTVRQVGYMLDHEHGSTAR
jgi:two-component system OmpR family response regulator